MDNWETLAQEWDILRSIIVDGAVTSESEKVKEAENKRQLCKSRANDNSAEVSRQNVPCTNWTL